MVSSQINIMSEGEEDSYGRPRRFAPSWPPKSSQKQSHVLMKCSDQFKKVTWPPKIEEPEEKPLPVTTIQLKEEMPKNDTAMLPVGTYKAAPTIYADEPDEFPEEIWPPPVPPNTNERVVYDSTRPKRVIRDYEVHFSKNAANPTEPSYRVPPGTLHVVSQRGVLSYDSVDIGAARMADEKLAQKKKDSLKEQ